MEETKAQGILADILEQLDWSVEDEHVNEWLEIFKTFVKKVPLCPECGNILVRRKFVDSWDVNKLKFVDLNEDLYCPVCGLRWAKTPPPHQFLKEAEKLVE